jgi:mannose-6-phosphate isomerase-like protein (cupin superfamily)
MPYVDLSAFPVTPTAFGRWQPLNAPLGLGAFGINAIECDPGEAIDTTHDETDTGQHEAYIVVAGRAEFRIGLDIYDAVPGTVVAAPDPASTRSFRPLVPGTRIICIGATPVEGAPAFGEWIG